MVYELSPSPTSEAFVAQRQSDAEAARQTAAKNGAAPLVEKAIGEGRPVRVVAIGAGFSGIGACIYLPQHIKNLDLQVYERATDIGGVWHHNKYMGAACDIPAHTYQFTFADNSQWSKFYAGGPEIHQYLTNVVDHYKLRPLIKLQHTVLEARWLENDGKWVIKVQDPTGRVFEDRCDFVYYATGLLSNPVWPKIPGRDTFKGVIHHTGEWDAAKEEAEGMDWSDKRVAVIGTGSSAIQVMPEMQRKCKQLVNFARSKTWVTPTFGDITLKKLGVDTEKSANHTFTDEQKQHFSDPANYREFRLMVERDLASAHFLTHRDSPLQTLVLNDAERQMQRRLASKPDISKALLPQYPIGCRRITPGPGYLDSLTKDNVTFVTDDLACFTERGLKTVTGEEYEVDAIICATGFDTSSVPRFPILGQGGINLQDMWTEEVRTYLAVSIPKMPNFFSILGPQAVVGSGNLLSMIEGQLTYVAKAIKKCQREGYKSMVVKKEPVDSFMKYTDDYFERTVFTTECHSWYKGGAGSRGGTRIRTLWPGSSQHHILSLKEPRWEDYDYTRLPEYKHTMGWLGDGHIPADMDPAFYYAELRAGYKETLML
ncbi:FAD-binding monooxygenase moxY [Vanrija pseudolonga]|uniref:FAD-binding monooxygenase moxY n=1 Tax=Vanrija pseudolonga TaxID=143232 RepID=A0AAF1BPN2_9TREE|nr:FAD-binding monooxygenase moxY [Vanrija pseudolonga]